VEAVNKLEGPESKLVILLYVPLVLKLSVFTLPHVSSSIFDRPSLMNGLLSYLYRSNS